MFELNKVKTKSLMNQLIKMNEIVQELLNKFIHFNDQFIWTYSERKGTTLISCCFDAEARTRPSGYDCYKNLPITNSEISVCKGDKAQDKSLLGII